MDQQDQTEITPAPRRAAARRGAHGAASRSARPVPRRSYRQLIATRSGRAIASAIAVAVCAAAVALAMLNAAQAPRHPYFVVKAQATPVFHPRTDIKVTLLPIPTPVVAAYRSLDVHLPVEPEEITIIAFHQAGSQPVALHMRSLVAIVKSSALHKRRPAQIETGPDEDAEIAGAENDSLPVVYSGPVLRLWRTGRIGEPDTAVDCGAKPGTAVLAPVTGAVTAVHMYKLYGQYDDYEIHILPSGWDSVDCVVLHVTDPKVRVGDQVTGGVTRLASVRRLSQWFASQLDEYTHDGGNHVHVQLDVLPRPGVVQLMGGLQTDFGTPRLSTPKSPH